MGCQQRKKLQGTTLRPRTCSADVGALSEVVELVTARVLSYFSSQSDHVHDLHVLGSAATRHEAVDATAALRCHAEWMDWSAMSSTQTISCRERTCKTISNSITWTVLRGHQPRERQRSPRPRKVYHEVWPLTAVDVASTRCLLEHDGTRCVSRVTCCAT